jgi:hypothetical protein
MAAPLTSTLARKWKIDILTTGPSTYSVVKGIAECKADLFAASVEDDDAYDDEGWGSGTKTKLAWSVELKMIRKRTAGTTTYDTGQEKLRTHARAFGDGGVAQVRIYDRDGGSEAYGGYAEVSWSAEGGKTSDLETVTVTLTGKGALTDIENPDAESGS